MSAWRAVRSDLVPMGALLLAASVVGVFLNIALRPQERSLRILSVVIALVVSYAVVRRWSAKIMAAASTARELNPEGVGRVAPRSVATLAWTVAASAGAVVAFALLDSGAITAACFAVIGLETLRTDRLLHNMERASGMTLLSRSVSRPSRKGRSIEYGWHASV